MKGYPDGFGANVQKQLRDLIVAPLRDSSTTESSHFPYIIVIDALDECEDKFALAQLLEDILRNVEDLRPLQFFITSRSENPIHCCFSACATQGVWKQHNISDISDTMVRADIKRYLRDALSSLKNDYDVPESWPPAAAVAELAHRCRGSFIYASTAVRFVRDPAFLNPNAQLELLIAPAAQMDPSPSDSLIDQLYLTVLTSAYPNISSKLAEQVRLILGSILLLQRPLSIEDLARLIGVEVSSVYNQCIGPLRSVLTLFEYSAGDQSPTQAATIRVVHPTFPEFLLSLKRCRDPMFFISSPSLHLTLAHRCLLLVRAVCAWKGSSSTDASVNVRSDAARYAFSWWQWHLSLADTPSRSILNEIQDHITRLTSYAARLCAICQPGATVCWTHYLTMFPIARVSLDDLGAELSGDDSNELDRLIERLVGSQQASLSDVDVGQSLVFYWLQIYATTFCSRLICAN